jgi:hypothetical protein
MIKAIETKYKGYRFRSRTEARWAVFFDYAGLKWEYEKEGYDIDGKWYLPDFYFPDYKWFAEVKGCEFTDDESFMCLRLSEETKMGCILFDGAPSYDRYPMYLWSEVNKRSVAGFLGFEGFGFHCGIDASRSARFEHGETGVSL